MPKTTHTKVLRGKAGVPRRPEISRSLPWCAVCYRLVQGVDGKHHIKHSRSASQQQAVGRGLKHDSIVVEGDYDSPQSVGSGERPTAPMKGRGTVRSRLAEPADVARKQPTLLVTTKGPPLPACASCKPLRLDGPSFRLEGEQLACELMAHFFCVAPRNSLFAVRVDASAKCDRKMPSRERQTADGRFICCSCVCNL